MFLWERAVVVRAGPGLLLTAEAGGGGAPQGCVAGPGHEGGRAPVRGAVGGEGGASAGAVAADGQQRVGAAADQDLGGGLDGQAVVAEQGRPVVRDAVEDWVARLGH